MFSFEVALLAAAGPSPWYERVAHSLPRIGEILAALVTAITLLGLGRSVLRRTIWRRRDRYARLGRLGTQAQLSFFTSVLGEPPAQRRSFMSNMTAYDDRGQPVPDNSLFVEAVWIDRDYFVHAYADADESVVAYSVTTRSTRFRPTFRPPWGQTVQRGWLMTKLGRPYRVERARAVKLARTRFSEMQRPDHASSWVGAHNWHYYEAVWGGNPGYYQWFVYSINDAGAGAWVGDAQWEESMHNFQWGFAQLEAAQRAADPKLALQQAAIAADAGQPDDFAEMNDDEFEAYLTSLAAQEEEPLPANWLRFRHATRPNTYTVISPALALDDYPGGEGKLWTYPIIFGANGHRVQTVAGAG
jgi:hypothetical protein